MKASKVILLIVFISLVIVATGLYFYVYNNPQVDYTNADVEMEVNARDLYSSFIVDESGASYEYIGKVISVEGIPGYIEEPQGMIIVGFVYGVEGMLGGEGVKCILKQDYQKILEAIVNAQSIKIKGLCAGFNGTDVIMEHCTLIN